MEKEKKEDRILHEIVNLYKLFNQAIAELKEQNNKQEKEITVLNKIVVHFDYCQSILNTELMSTTAIAKDALACGHYLDQRIDDIIPEVKEYEHSDKTKEEDDLFLTKKQKNSRKKHERRKSKRMEQRISRARENWKQQNGGHNIEGMEYI